jgi:hypothetical protein
MAFPGTGQRGFDDPSCGNDEEKELPDTEHVFPFSVAAARLDPFHQDKGRGSGNVPPDRNIPGICESVENRVDYIVRVPEDH